MTVDKGDERGIFLLSQIMVSQARSLSRNGFHILCKLMSDICSAHSVS